MYIQVSLRTWGWADPGSLNVSHGEAYIFSVYFLPIGHQGYKNADIPNNIEYSGVSFIIQVGSLTTPVHTYKKRSSHIQLGRIP